MNGLLLALEYTTLAQRRAVKNVKLVKRKPD